MTALSSLLPPANVANPVGTLPVANGGTGLSSPGANGNLLTSNGTAWSSATPAAGGATMTAVASGSLSDGSRVIVNSGGTVSVVAETQVSTPIFGTNAQFSPNAAVVSSAVYDSSSQRVVIAYVNSNYYCAAVVGIVTGSSISFGTPVVFFSTTDFGQSISAAYDANAQRVVIFYRDADTFGTAVVATISGTSISFGTPVRFSFQVTSFIAATYDSVAQRVFVAYRNDGDSGRGYGAVGTVSGTSISFGTSNYVSFNTISYLSATYDTTAQRVVVVYTNESSANRGTATVVTVSGTSFSVGSTAQFNANPTFVMSATYHSAAQRVVIAYRNNGNSNRGTAIVGTVSGTSISFGTAVVFSSVTTDGIAVTYDSVAQRVVVSYNAGANINSISASVSGTTISFGTAAVLSGSSTSSNSAMTYDTAQRRSVFAFRNESAGSIPAANVISLLPSNLTADNFVGFSNAAYSNGQTATIQITGSIDDAQTGLIAGRSYFVQPNGGLSTTPSSPSVFAGTAVSASRIIVRG
jgi:hypothetical protein